jgi:hypothetical protein
LRSRACQVNAAMGRGAEYARIAALLRRQDQRRPMCQRNIISQYQPAPTLTKTLNLTNFGQ